jgi:hypothetical protein
MQFNYGVLLGALMPWMVWAQPNAWINEFHYDNVGADADEFIEVVLENAAAYALSDFAVVLYNGSGGTSYGTHRLDTFTEGATEGAYTVYFKYIPGLQNGAPDGLALCYQGHLLQFLSYEGTLTAVGGCADGILSTDIGVAEDGTTPAGYSLQLTGLGARYADFSWASPQPASPGAINTTQRLIGQVTCRLALLGTLEVLSAAQGRAQILGTDGIQREQSSAAQCQLAAYFGNWTGRRRGLFGDSTWRLGIYWKWKSAYRSVCCLSALRPSKSTQPVFPPGIDALPLRTGRHPRGAPRSFFCL